MIPIDIQVSRSKVKHFLDLLGEEGELMFHKHIFLYFWFSVCHIPTGDICISVCHIFVFSVCCIPTANICIFVFSVCYIPTADIPC